MEPPSPGELDLSEPRPLGSDSQARTSKTQDNRLNAGHIRASKELPACLLPLIEESLHEAETWLAQNRPAEFREQLLNLYFRLHSFRRTAELYDERFVTIYDPV